MNERPAEENTPPSRAGGRDSRATRRVLILAVVLVVAAAIIAAQVFGSDDDGAPDDDSAGVPTRVAGMAENIPPPELCRVPPRPVAQMQSLVATPAATPAPVVAPPPPAVGTPADLATAEEIAAVYREAVACLNAGNFARAYALYSDDYVRRILAGAAAHTGIDPALVAIVIATPSPSPPMTWTAIVAQGGVELLPDGRASAVFVTVAVQQSADPDAARPHVIFFVNDNGRWLIDGSFDPTSIAPPAATPQA